MLQIFRHDSKSATNIRHLLDVLIKSIHYLNPNQTAVIGFDQPLYALAKKIQWFQLTAYGQQKLVLMLGTLHIKMVMLICLGKWLQDSGWTIPQPNAGITSSGNDSLISGHDVAKTKYVHQVTASTLCRLMTSAFEHSKEEGYTLDFVEWHASNELGNPQFQFWSVAMKMKVDYVLFLWSIKSSNFKFYVEPNGKFLP